MADRCDTDSSNEVIPVDQTAAWFDQHHVSAATVTRRTETRYFLDLE